MLSSLLMVMILGSKAFSHSIVSLSSNAITFLKGDICCFGDGMTFNRRRLSSRALYKSKISLLSIQKYLKSEYTRSYNCYDIYKQQTRHRVAIYFLDNICYSV